MSFVKICQLADQFEKKLKDQLLDDDLMADDEQDAKIHVPSWVSDPKSWRRAKKKIDKYFDKYKDPYGAVVNLYKILSGKNR